MLRLFLPLLPVLTAEKASILQIRARSSKLYTGGGTARVAKIFTHNSKDEPHLNISTLELQEGDSIYTTFPQLRLIPRNIHDSLKCKESGWNLSKDGAKRKTQLERFVVQIGKRQTLKNKGDTLKEGSCRQGLG